MEPFPTPQGALLQCNNEDCLAVFARPDSHLILGDWVNACPECQYPHFMVLPRIVILALFHHIIEHDWTEDERLSLRIVSEAEMEPYNPLSRDL